MKKDFNRFCSVLWMFLASILVILVSESYNPKGYPPAQVMILVPVSKEEETEDRTPFEETMDVEKETTASQEEEELMAEPEDERSVVRLNMAFQYQDGEETDVGQSIAGQALTALTERDAAWISDIYEVAGTPPTELVHQMGREVSDQLTEWTKVNITFYDGDGQPVSGYSNAKEILSMASVYAYWKNMEDQTSFFEYAEDLWAASHQYLVQVGEVYECDSSLDEHASSETFSEEVVEPEFVSDTVPSEEELLLMEQYQPEDIPADWEEIEGPHRDIWAAVVKAYQATSSIVEEPEQNTCPGHIDLNISASIYGLSEEQGLFSKDAVGNMETSQDEKWKGWDFFNRLYVKALNEADWYEEYDLTVSTSMYIRNPLSSAEIDYYMNMLPPDVSKERELVIRQALQSVGCIPYYWGGKASRAGFDGNLFGTVVSPDEDGRVLKGLDCSGWINWVYWTALGVRLPYESTSGLIQCGSAISREELQPGDIIVRTGESAHVYLFLAWAEGDDMYVIHETSGTINNVTISKFNVHWPYYRKLVSEVK